MTYAEFTTFSLINCVKMNTVSYDIKIIITRPEFILLPLRSDLSCRS